MLDVLIEWDYRLLAFLNPIGHPYLDGIMILISSKWIWVPLYLGLIYIICKKYRSRFFIPLLFCILSITLADQITSSFMKPYFERLRPCHDTLTTDWLQKVGPCGGWYGFASSHAANTFSLAVFFITLFNTKSFKILLLWASIVSYSRIYLGVHFPGDVFIGSIIGITAGFLCGKTSLWMQNETVKNTFHHHNPKK